MHSETIPQVWPASLSLSLSGPFVALPSQHDVSPVEETHRVGVIFDQTETNTTPLRLDTLTIRLTRAMSSSSSFFLWIK